MEKHQNYARNIQESNLEVSDLGWIVPNLFCYVFL
jgi:hypothetical protein